MDPDLELRRKWTFRAHGRQVVFVKRAREHPSHVLVKALLWALYLPEYPDLIVEVPVAGERYRPDLVAVDADGRPRFWAEAGQVGRAKLRSLARRHPGTHFAWGRWGDRIDPFRALVAEALAGCRRTAPWDLIRFPRDSAARFIDPGGKVRVRHQDLEWLRFGPDPPC